MIRKGEQEWERDGYAIKAGNRIIRGVTSQTVQDPRVLQATYAIFGGTLGVPLSQVQKLVVFEKTTAESEVRLFAFMSGSSEILTGGFIIDGVGGACVPKK